MSDQVGNQNVGFLMTRLRFFHSKILPKDADGYENIEDPDHTASVGAV